MYNLRAHPRTLAAAVLVLTVGPSVVVLSTPPPYVSECHLKECPLAPLHNSGTTPPSDSIILAERLYTRYLQVTPPSTLKFYRDEIEHFELVRQRMLIPLLDPHIAQPISPEYKPLRSLDALIEASYLRALPVPTLAYAISAKVIDPARAFGADSRAVLQAMRVSEELEPTAVYLAKPPATGLNHKRLIADLLPVAATPPACYTVIAASCLARVDSCRGIVCGDLRANDNDGVIRYLLATDSLLADGGLRAIRAYLPNPTEPSEHSNVDAMYLGGDLWIDRESPLLRSHAVNLVFNYLNNRVDALTLILEICRRENQTTRGARPLVRDSLQARHFLALFSSLSDLCQTPEVPLARDVRLFGEITCAEFAQATADLHQDLASTRNDTAMTVVGAFYDSVATAQLVAIREQLKKRTGSRQRDRILSYLASSPVLAKRLGDDAALGLERLREAQ